MLMHGRALFFQSQVIQKDKCHACPSADGQIKILSLVTIMTSEFYYELNGLLGALETFLDPNSDFNSIRFESRTSSSSSFFVPTLIAPQDRTIPIEIQTKLQAEERRIRDLKSLESQVERRPSLLQKHQDEIQTLRLSKDPSVLENYVPSEQDKEDEKRRAIAMSIFIKLTEMSYKPYITMTEGQTNYSVDTLWNRCEHLQESAKRIESLSFDIKRPNSQQRVFECKPPLPSPIDLRTLPTWNTNVYLKIPMSVEKEYA